MTTRETNLRLRIDVLLDEREQLRGAIQEKDRELARHVRRLNSKTFRRCCYCGRPTYGAVCPLHRDLAQLEHKAVA